ncbi:7tm Chemosensory receptor [Popillia japonica]|uniref:Gustatory receptor n=1 Tax=Popillia japonica TaxID=7064 RepID=A0AAW1M2V1_POPJA
MSVLYKETNSKIFKKRIQTRNVIAILSPLLTLSVVSGVSTLWWNVNFTKLTSRTSLKIFITLLTLISLAYLVVLPIGLGVVTRKPNLNATNSSNSEEDTPNTHLTIKLTIPFSVSLVGFLNKLKMLVTVQSNFIPIVEELLIAETKLQYPTKKFIEERKSVFYLLIGMFLYSFPMQLILLFINITPISFILFLSTVYTNFGIFTVELQFCTLSVLIVRRLRFLHERITSIKTSKYASTIYTVQNLKDVHRDLNEVCKMVIDYYNVPILMSLTYTTLGSFMNVYFAIFGGFKDAGVKEVVTKRPTLEIVGHYFYAVYYFGRFCLVCVAADRMMSEVGSTKLYLADVLNRNLLGDLRKEVKHFFNYASCKKLRFTICGLFKLEVAVITTLVRVKKKLKNRKNILGGTNQLKPCGSSLGV